MDSTVRMMRRFSVFLKVALDLEGVRDAVAAIVGRPLIPMKNRLGETIYGATVFWIELHLVGHHHFEDDSGIEFSRYEYWLELIPLRAGEGMAGYDAMYEGMALFLAARLSKTMSWPTLVVFNLQSAIASFEP